MVVRFLVARQWMPRGRQLDVEFTLAEKKWNLGTLIRIEPCFSRVKAGVGVDVMVGEIVGFAGIFAAKCTRIRTKPEKTGKNLWKPKNSD